MAMIMVVDDEPDVAYIAARILKTEGHETIPAYSGEEALEKLEGVTPDLITLDIMMPGIDGFETLKRIREKEETSSIPVVMISVKQDEGDIVKALELGVNDYFTKPYNETILLAKVRSILKFKDMEERLREYSKELERKVKERTQELEESNHLKGLFMDIISHDIKNPLTTIILYLDFLKEELDKTGLSTREFKSLAVIEKSTDSAIELLENATTYARLENPGNLEFESIDISLILKGLVEKFGPMIVEHGSTVVMDIPDKCPIKAHYMIEEVFVNLLSNALKYSPRGTGIEIGIIEDESGYTVKLKDQGQGIPDDYKLTIFERFERVKNNSVKGSGLGLAISKRIVDLHNGRVWVEDNNPGGSVFFVRLPKD